MVLHIKYLTTTIVKNKMKLSFEGSWCLRGSMCRRPRLTPGSPSLEPAPPPSSPSRWHWNRLPRGLGRESPRKAEPGPTPRPMQVYTSEICSSLVHVTITLLSRLKAYRSHLKWVKDRLMVRYRILNFLSPLVFAKLFKYRGSGHNFYFLIRIKILHFFFTLKK